jgi:hypothetical protein
LKTFLAIDGSFVTLAPDGRSPHAPLGAAFLIVIVANDN